MLIPSFQNEKIKDHTHKKIKSFSSFYKQNQTRQNNLPFLTDCVVCQANLIKMMSDRSLMI